MYKVDNAVIMAAGTSSRFAPLSYERPKSLIEVKGEILIERQIRQIKDAGISDIYVVTGYKGEQLEYLREKYGVYLIKNDEYDVRNNNSSIKTASDVIANTYICSADNYFSINPFEKEVDESYYSALYSEGKTKEWCVHEDAGGYIDEVTIGGENSWYMMGHTFWSEEFSRTFIKILDEIYEESSTKNMLWEDIYINNLNKLKMMVRRYNDDDIFEFDSLDELRIFDKTYICNTRSEIIKKIAAELNVSEENLCGFRAVKSKNLNEAIGFEFFSGGKTYYYEYKNGKILECDSDN